jgi:tripartite-type tricarboxylate transporter receptor subunit TctC
MKRLMVLVVAAAAIVAGRSDASAQSYPTRPINLIVPLGTGGSTDVIARIMAEGMRARLGQPVIVENVSGAGGTIGVGRVARAVPDGYTIGIGQWGTNMANGAIYPLTYDLLKDFAPISLIATQPLLIDARKTLPADDLKGLVTWLKANSGKATAGNSGIGTPTHVASVLFQSTIGTSLQMVPYRSAGMSMQDLIAGNIDILLDTPLNSMPQIAAGTIKAFALTAPQRLDVAPAIPTVDEAGLPGFYFTFWHAVWAPAGTPHEIIAKLNASVVGTLADPGVRKRLIELAQDIFPPAQQTPEALAAFQKAEMDKWWPVIKAAGIKPE